MLFAPQRLCATSNDRWKSGISIAMGQSSDEVKRAATYTTTSSEEEGFAHAVERYILVGGA